MIHATAVDEPPKPNPPATHITEVEIVVLSAKFIQLNIKKCSRLITMIPNTNLYSHFSSI